MKILLIDDHALFRAGLRLLLGTISADAQIIEAGSIREALERANENPDLGLCLLDLGLKNESGFDGIRTIKQSVPDITMVVVSGSDDSATVHRCIDAGAMSYIPKSAEPEVLREALRQALNGNIYLPRHILAEAVGGEASPPTGPSAAPALTPRQIDVLRGLCRGLPNKLICDELNLSENTVKDHVTTIFRILRVRNRTQAVIKAGQLGLRLSQ